MSFLNSRFLFYSFGSWWDVCMRGVCSIVFCWCYVDCSTSVRYVVQSFYVHIDFSSTCSINYGERGIEISEYNCVFISHFSSMSFASCILKVSFYVHESLRLLSIISSWWIDSFIIMKWPCLSLVIFFALKSTLPNVYWATYSSFFWLVLVWCIFLYPLLLT